MAADPRRPIIIIRKKASGGHAHHGGAWKVAYADFVTAMMALFMVLWLLASSDQKSRNEIANYFRTGVLPNGELAMERAAQLQPAVVEQTGVPAAARQQMLEQQAEQLRDAIETMQKVAPEVAKIASQVSVQVTPDGVLIEAIDQERGESMLFDVSSAILKPALVDLLTRLAPELAKLPGTVELDGHTDARPFLGNDVRDNWSLSFARADAARRILEQAGLPAQQIGGVIGRADARPHDPAHRLAAENRRLGILVRPPAGLPDPEGGE